MTLASPGNAAAEEGVDHFVFSGVGSHHRDTGIPHFESAWDIEQHARDLDLPMTVLQPVFFFQNLEAFAGDILDGTLAFPLEEGVSLQMVDVDDVGHAAAVSFADPAEFIGEEFAAMCGWFDEVGYVADIDALGETFGVAFTGLEEYLREHGWEDKEGMASIPGWVKASS